MKHLPKLTMRDLLWLMALVALAILWRMDHREVTAFRREREAARVEAEANRLAAEAEEAAKQAAMASWWQQQMNGQVTPPASE